MAFGNILENNAFRGVVIVNEQKEDNYDDEINTLLVQVTKLTCLSRSRLVRFHRAGLVSVRILKVKICYMNVLSW